MNQLSSKSLEQTKTKFDNMFNRIGLAKKEINSLVFGQNEVIDLILVSILSEGHALLVGLPGLAKTRIVNFLSIILGLEAKRIQFTPDLMPADIIGSEILEDISNNNNRFKFLKGPIFSQFLLADEINRASPRTQSALLQAMQEKRVTIAGINYDLPKPFHVLATQNPIDQEGTYPLPEAQLDRFLMNIKISYPDLNSEKKILELSTDSLEKLPKNIISFTQLLEIQSFIKKIPVGESLIKYILEVITNSRPETSKVKSVKDNVLWGPSPRASLALLSASRSKAFLDNRYSPSIFDVQSLIKPILIHRMNLNISAKSEGIKINEILNDVIDNIEY